MDPNTALGLAGLGLTAVSVTAYRLFPKIPKALDVLGFLFGVALLGAAGIGYYAHFFEGHQLKWVGSKGDAATLIGGWSTALVFTAIVLAATWAATQVALRIMSAPTQPQQPQNPESSGRSAEQILTFVAAVKNLKGPRRPIKITSIQEWMPFSKMLANALRVADCELQENAAAADFVFPAGGKRHDKVVIRFRNGDLFGFAIWLGLTPLASCVFEEFPDTDNYNFVQIEIGGSP